jgi:hypothetical protein
MVIFFSDQLETQETRRKAGGAIKYNEMQALGTTERGFLSQSEDLR